ncbi:MAG: fatty acid desaturase [Thermoanaerobaculia bacterium]|nr:fatty acid desaturase [Thermoanaerobaculia bacterium]
MTPAPTAEPDRFPIPTRTNLTIIGLQLAAVSGIILGVRAAPSWGVVALWAVAFGIVGNSIYAIIHEAEHGVLHPNPKINEGLGVLMSLLFPAPYHLIRQGHIGHHLRNRSDDEAFDLFFDGEHFVTKCLQWYSILTGVFWISIVLANVAVLVAPVLLDKKLYRFDRPSYALFDSLNPVYRRLIRLEALLAILVHTAIVIGFGVSPLRYAAMYFGFGFSWSALQYLHHYGTERHVVRGARNVWILPLLDLILLNHNWHLTHHKHPVVSWKYLPALGRKEDPERTFLLWHYVKMWRPPRYSDERVENRHAGRVIR